MAVFPCFPAAGTSITMTREVYGKRKPLAVDGSPSFVERLGRN